MKNYRLIFLAISIAIFSTSCLVDDEDATLDAMSNTPYSVGFKNTSLNITYFEDIGAVEQPVPINVFGGGDGTGVDSDVTVNYTINKDLSTATEGEEFSISNSSVTISEGEEFGILELVANTGKFNLAMPTTLVIDITTTSPAEGIAIISDYSRITITFIGCETDLAGSYTVAETGDVLTITESTTGNYIVDNLFIVTPAFEWYFSDVCDELTITGFELGGYDLLGSGVVNSDGSLSFTGVQLVGVNPQPSDFTLIPN